MSAFDFLFNKQDKEPYQGETLDNQPIYNLSNKKSSLIDHYRFLVLGAYGKKDKMVYNNVKQAIGEMGYSDDVIFVRNNSEVLKFGVVDTPALVVDETSPKDKGAFRLSSPVLASLYCLFNLRSPNSKLRVI